MADQDKYAEVYDSIVDLVGGKDNIANFFHCVSRLRFEVHDKDKVQVEAVGALSGIKGTNWSGNQFQAIVGNDVADVYKGICSRYGLSENAEVPADGPAEKLALKDVPGAVLRAISGCVSPVIPMLGAVGLCAALYSILGPTLLNVISAESDLYMLLYWASQAGLYFMPFFVAVAAAKQFGVNQFYAMIFAALMLYPDFMARAAEGTFTVYGIPVIPTQYNSQVLPIILTTFTLSKVNAVLERYLKGPIAGILRPLAMMLIMMPLVLCVFCPFGVLLGSVIGSALEAITGVAGPVGAFLVGALWLPLVTTGMHFPIAMPAIVSFMAGNPDFSVLAIVNGICYVGFAADIATFLRTRDPELKQLSVECMVSVFLGGVIEPQLYSYYLSHKKVFFAHCMGQGVFGVIVYLLHVGMYNMASNNFLVPLSYTGPTSANIIGFAIATAASMATTIALILVLGVDEQPKELAA